MFAGALKKLIVIGGFLQSVHFFAAAAAAASISFFFCFSRINSASLKRFAVKISVI